MKVFYSKDIEVVWVQKPLHPYTNNKNNKINKKERYYAMKTIIRLRHKKEIMNYTQDLLLTWGFEQKKSSDINFLINDIEIKFNISDLTLTLGDNIFHYIANHFDKQTLIDTLALIDFLNSKIVNYAFENDFLRKR